MCCGQKINFNIKRKVVCYEQDFSSLAIVIFLTTVRAHQKKSHESRKKPLKIAG